jgi:uncharacterized protein (TIGR02453 family)
MSEFPSFSGFPEEGVRFLADLRHNNNKEWFEANKSTYRDQLLSPAQAFVADLGERLKAISEGIIYDTRTNGSGSMMRIYRDVRFSKDKTPYKTWLSFIFWEGQGKKTEHPGFYFRFSGEAAELAVGMHGFPKDTLAAYREAVADDKLGSELVSALHTIRDAGDYALGGEQYKRVPQGYDADHPRAALLRHKGIFGSPPPLDVALVATPELVDVCFEHFQTMAPLHRWLVKVDQRVKV